MKIGFLITYFYPKMGGAESNCYYLARELAKSHEVHVFCSGDVDSEEVIDNIHVHRAKQSYRFKYYLASYPSLTKKMLDNPVDILHIHGLGFPQHDKSVRVLKQKFPETKIVCTPHGPFMALKKYGFFANLFKNYYTSKIKVAVKSYDAIIQVNPFQKEWMTKEYDMAPNKIFLIPNGIPKSSLKTISKSNLSKIISKYNIKDKTVISYIGRIQKYKGLDQVINVLPIKEGKTSCVAVLIGSDAGDKERLENLAKEKQVSNEVIFTGQVTEEEKLGLLEISDIFVFPSEWEAFGIATLEAMAHGNAVISTKTEGGKYLIEDGKNGFLFDYQDIGALKNNLVKLMQDSKLLSKIQKINRKKSRSFLWEDIAIDLEKLYNKIK